MQIRTVLGDMDIPAGVAALAHEHICNYSEWIYQMDPTYMDKTATIDAAVQELAWLREKHGLGLFLDCTPVNIGRDVELLREVARWSGVAIVCSTGFYYQEEPMLYETSAEKLTAYMVRDAANIHAGLIKAGVEAETLSPFVEKLLYATAMAQKELHLPIVLHTNARNRNGEKAVQLLLREGVSPTAITVGHLSDTEDMAYIGSFAEMGCYVGLDRLYGSMDEGYIRDKVGQIQWLCDHGYADRVLLSHDDALFNGFAPDPHLKETRFAYVFAQILPRMDKALAIRLTQENPRRMLCCK